MREHQIHVLVFPPSPKQISRTRGTHPERPPTAFLASVPSCVLPRDDGLAWQISGDDPERLERLKHLEPLHLIDVCDTMSFRVRK